MQSTETKGSEEKFDDETSVSAGFSGIKKRDYYYSEPNLCFLIFSCLIFESSVAGNFPLLSARAVARGFAATVSRANGIWFTG
jgi:hypothetical protein